MIVTHVRYSTRWNVPHHVNSRTLETLCGHNAQDWPMLQPLEGKHHCEKCAQALRKIRKEDEPELSKADHLTDGGSSSDLGEPAGQPESPFIGAAVSGSTPIIASAFETQARDVLGLLVKSICKVTSQNATPVDVAQLISHGILADQLLKRRGAP